MRFYTKRAILFIVINFICLGIGNIPTMKGVLEDWYALGNQAPWTPPGWFFGVAWSTIMIAFGFYMTSVIDNLLKKEKKQIIILYVTSCILNILWCYLFFGSQLILIGLITIVILFILTLYFGYYALKIKKPLSFILVSPYFTWLAIATSLNAYFYIYN
jgi:translocator protein